MHHPYVAGYSVLPQLRKIEPQDVFETSSEELATLRELKQEAMRSQIWCVERDCTSRLKADVLLYFRDRYPFALPEFSTLDELAPSLAEDFVIHRYDPAAGRDWMAFGAVCFPSDWRPEEKVGRSFREIHAPVPGMELDRSRKLVETIVHSGPFERFVWSVLFEPRINWHPRVPRRRFAPTAPHAWVRVERQVTVGFPAHHAVLFLLKQSLIPEPEIDKPALARAIRGMTPAQRAYKGLDADYDAILAWLEKTDNDDQNRK